MFVGLVFNLSPVSHQEPFFVGTFFLRVHRKWKKCIALGANIRFFCVKEGLCWGKHPDAAMGLSLDGEI